MNRQQQNHQSNVYGRESYHDLSYYCHRISIKKATPMGFVSSVYGNGLTMIQPTVVPTKSDNDIIFCLQLLIKTITCTLHLG